MEWDQEKILELIKIQKMMKISLNDYLFINTNKINNIIKHPSYKCYKWVSYQRPLFFFYFFFPPQFNILQITDSSLVFPPLTAWENSNQRQESYN